MNLKPLLIVLFYTYFQLGLLPAHWERTYLSYLDLRAFRLRGWEQLKQVTFPLKPRVSNR